MAPTLVFDKASGQLVATGGSPGGPFIIHFTAKTLYARLEVGPVTPDIRELTAQTIARVRGTDEAREGFAAFLEKRPAAWIPQRGE